MLRHPYIGDIPNIGGVPVQGEARAYFERMATPASRAFRDAVNWAIWRWKAIGAWPLIKGLWILAADTQQAGLLSVIGDTPRDAVVVGVAPTFTALKGFSGFTTGKQVKFPITSAILGSDSVYAFMAGRVVPQQDVTDPENPVTIDGAFIVSDAGTGTGNVGHFQYHGASGGVLGANATLPLTQCSALATAIVVGGHKLTTVISAGASGAIGGSTAARSSNYITRSLALSPLNRLCAYGFLDAAATTAQCRQFSAILAELLNALGALD